MSRLVPYITTTQEKHYDERLALNRSLQDKLITSQYPQQKHYNKITIMHVLPDGVAMISRLLQNIGLFCRI